MKVTQKPEDYEKALKEHRRAAAFESWRRKLRQSEQLPRGKFFKGKQPGGSIVFFDECWKFASHQN